MKKKVVLSTITLLAMLLLPLVAGTAKACDDVPEPEYKRIPIYLEGDLPGQTPVVDGSCSWVDGDVTRFWKEFDVCEWIPLSDGAALSFYQYFGVFGWVDEYGNSESNTYTWMCINSHPDNQYGWSEGCFVMKGTGVYLDNLEEASWNGELVLDGHELLEGSSLNLWINLSGCHYVICGELIVPANTLN